MKSISDTIKNKPWMGWLLFLGTLLIVFFLGLLASSIMQRRSEALLVNKPKVTVSQWEVNDSVWGINYPREYESYLKTADTSFRSAFGGSSFINMLEIDPKLVVLWAGYSFSKDYNQGRGHYYAVDDIRHTLRTGAPMGPDEGPQPNTCWACKSPDVPRVMNQVGIAEFYKGKWASRGNQIVNPIGCADCHDAETQNLRISRPALAEAFQKMGQDITKVSYQQMRSMVCAQCHVEYYFHGEDKYLVFPWEKEILCRAHFEAKAAWDAGAGELEMNPALLLIRHAQWRWDFVAASHGATFHSPVECLRILGTALEKASEARLLIARILSAHGINTPVEFPDISTKEKAQALAGIDRDKLVEEKNRFLETIVPGWIEEYGKKR
jgi:formate-dependent nitrite reductase cytochrome c552 subunit